MDAGPELDAAIAEKIMGIGRHPSNVDNPYPKYSTNIEAAWEVVEEIAKQGFMVQIQYRKGAWIRIFHQSSTKAIATADTAPHAICLAALKVVQ